MNIQYTRQKRRLIGYNSYTFSCQSGKPDNNIFGIMLESNLVEGRQDVVSGQPLTYGQSITDACVNWDDTQSLLLELATAVQLRRG